MLGILLLRLVMVATQSLEAQILMVLEAGMFGWLRLTLAGLCSGTKRMEEQAVIMGGLLCRRLMVAMQWQVTHLPMALATLMFGWLRLMLMVMSSGIKRTEEQTMIMGSLWWGLLMVATQSQALPFLMALATLMFGWLRLMLMVMSSGIKHTAE